MLSLVAMLLSAASMATAGSFAYVSSFGTDRVTVVDGTTGSIVGSPIQFPAGVMPYGVAVNPAGTRAYVANFGNGSVSIIDTATNSEVVGSPVTICGGCMPQGIAVDANGTRVYIAGADGTIWVLDATTNAPPQQPLVRTTGAFGGIVVVGSRAFVADFGGGNVLAIDVNTGVITPLPLSFSMFGIAANPSGTRVYVPYGKINLNQEYDLEVAVVDTSGPTIVASVPVGMLDNNSGASPAGIVVSPSGTRVYVAISAENTVDVIDATTNTRVARVPIGAGTTPYGVALDPSGARVFVGNSGNGTLKLIDTATNTVSAPISVGAAPLVFGSFVDDPPQFLLTLSASPAAGGTISGTPAPSATGKYDYGKRVTVTATAATGYQFTGWTGACTGTGACNVTMTGDMTVIANFALVQYTLTPAVSPSGAGTTTPSVPTKYDYNTPVSVTATAATGYQFTGWTGACTGTGACNVTMTSDKTVTANFALVQYTLTPGVSPSAAGTITPSVPTKYDYNTPVSVTATANPGYQFTSWSGACTGTGACNVTMTGDKSVTANFAVVQYTLTPAVNPSGAGATTPSVPTKYDYNTLVSVTATANPGYQFTGWTGACTGTGPCSVTMTGDKSVTANFAVVQYTLMPGTNPSGAGTIIPSAPTRYNYNTTVIVTTTANPGYQFTGWSGACTGIGPCSVIMTGDKSVTANFVVLQYTLTPSVNPSGAGTTTPSVPTKYNYNTLVSVTAAAAAGYQFTGWSGACTGTGPCSVTMTGDRSVTASFAPVVVQQFTLTLTQDGTGTGAVGALPSSSTGQYDVGTDVSVTATPGANCKFTGWSGACTGTGSCKVKMDASKKVSATFLLTSPCDDRIAELQKKVAADKRHGRWSHDVQEGLRLYAAAQTELAKARAKVGENDKQYVKALKQFNQGKTLLCAGRYWRAAHEFWEAYQTAHKILEQHRR